MALDGDGVLFQELTDGKVLVYDGDVYRVRVEHLELPHELIRFIETGCGEMSIEEIA